MFTKEYIKECDCEEIQGLRPALKYGDFTTFSNAPYEDHNFNSYPYCNENNSRNKLVLWLPTGDQLDEEIVKICKRINCTYHTNFVGDWVIYVDNNDSVEDTPQFVNTNPLIAKIKLLKQLLASN
jgi:hypothetical protein